MALTKDDLVIGNTLYHLKLVNNLYTQDKIYMVDSEGNRWSRYDKPRWTYEVSPMVICGTIDHIITGKVDLDMISDKTYHMELEGEITYFHESQLIDTRSEDELRYNWSNVYINEAEAIAVGEALCDKKNGVK
jgi:hypothetical protein